MTGPPGPEPLRLGVVGAGAFARMVVDAIQGLDSVCVVRVTDVAADRAQQLADRVPGATTATSLDDLLDDPRVDAVVVATPPATHAALGLAVLAGRRHLFVEKPLATTVADGRRLVRAAADSGCVVVVDHVLRHNPILAAVVRLRDEILGPVRRLLYENDASDEGLPPDHWFWEETQSGGILVEHGVHALDAAHFLLGSAPISVQATAARRDGTGVVDLVSLTATHPGGVLATHTHSFRHLQRCERQLLRLDHGAAETRVSGWIPVDADVDLWTDDAGLTALTRLTADAHALLAVGSVPLDERARVRVHVERDAAPGPRPHHASVAMTLGGPAAKQDLYAASVRSGVADLAHCVRTGDQPIAGVTDAAGAVAVAAAGTRAARTGTAVSLRLPALPLLPATATA